MNLALLVVIARPVASCLAAGTLKTLLDYQGGQHWTPAIVDGAITALVMAGSLLGITGAVTGVQKATSTAAAANRSAKAPPTS